MSLEIPGIASKLGLDINPFAQGMLQANAIASVFPHTVQTFLGNPLLGLIEIAKDAASEIKNIFLEVAEGAHHIAIESAIAGVSEQYFKKIAASAKLASIGVEELGHTFAILARNASESDENPKLADAFEKIGVEATDAAGNVRPMNQLFNDVANGIAKLTNRAEQADVAMRLLGRGGAAMLPFIKEGTASFNEFAERVGAMTGESFEGLSEGAKKFKELSVLAGYGIASVRKAFTEPIFEVINEHAKEFEQIMVDVFAAMRSTIRPELDQLLAWVRTHPEEIKAKITAAAQEIIKALELLGKGIAFVVEHFESILKIFEAFVAYKAIITAVEAIITVYKGLAAAAALATAANTALAASNAAVAASGGGTAGTGGTVIKSLGKSTLYGAAGAGVGYAAYGDEGGAAGGGIGGTLGGIFFGPAGAAVGALGLGYVGHKIQQHNEIHIELSGDEGTPELAAKISREMKAALKRGENESQAAEHVNKVLQGVEQPFGDD